ncbi:SDR family NAD(P)-dependent oxidoreductase [Nocardioides alkalitolerans]|uniref:SDR family NAD(P)-dependent oxidoreductase n=1 Tax=Nocardioides alkalitolerans TaxID=281714 RepID=UPI00048E3D55|nr:SDR family NAD(P)-dependent oxidoreductase [Nocardioides alkalitolerans]
MTRSAVVTGAANGIGRAVAREATRRGYAVVLSDVDAAGLREIGGELAAEGHDVATVVADVSDGAAVAGVVDVARERHGRLDLLVNNAAIEATDYLWETSPERWERMLDVNVLGVVHGVRAAVPLMLRQAGAPAAIVNVASLAALASGPARQSAYNASKHAVLALSESLQLDLDDVGADVTVHVLLPGPVATTIFDDATAGEGAASEYRASLRDYVNLHGVTPQTAAESLFAGLEDGAFWISPHPEMHAVFAERRAHLLTSRLRPRAVPVGT